jgi:hypothetical protein
MESGLGWIGLGLLFLSRESSSLFLARSASMDCHRYRDQTAQRSSSL